MARTTSPAKSAPTTAQTNRANPVWFKPLMFGFMLVGLAWIIVYYISEARFPLPGLNEWNILIGFGIAFIGFVMTTRWR